jgi:uncharacterized membrane protein
MKHRYDEKTSIGDPDKERMSFMNGTPLNSDEKLWAGFSYLGLLCCFIPALVIFFLKKNESNEIKFHSLQAIAFWVICFGISLVLNIAQLSMFMDPTGMLAMLIGLISLAYSCVALLAWLALTILTFMGKNVELPVIGPLIRSKI